MEKKKGGMRMAVSLKGISSMTGAFGDNVWATGPVRELGNGAGRSVTVDLNSGHDQIATSTGRRFSTSDASD